MRIFIASIFLGVALFGCTETEISEVTVTPITNSSEILVTSNTDDSNIVIASNTEANLKNKIISYGNTNGNLTNEGYVISVENNIFIGDNSFSDEGFIYKYNHNDINKKLEKVTEDYWGSLNYYDDKLFYNSHTGIVSFDLNTNYTEQFYYL